MIVRYYTQKSDKHPQISSTNNGLHHPPLRNAFPRFTSRNGLRMLAQEMTFQSCSHTIFIRGPTSAHIFGGVTIMANQSQRQWIIHKHWQPLLVDLRTTSRNGHIQLSLAGRLVMTVRAQQGYANHGVIPALKPCC